MVRSLHGPLRVREPGGFEGRLEVPPPLEANDPAAADRPGVSFVLDDVDVAPTASRVEADGGDHPVAGIEELMKLVPSRIERFGDVAQRDLHLRDPATHAGVDGLGRVDV